MSRSIALLAALALSAAFAQPAAVSQGTPEARAAFDQARTAATAGDTAKAASLYRQAIDIDPRYVDAHDGYISATLEVAFAYDEQKHAGNVEARTQAEQELKTLYEGWAKAHPDNAVYEWALAKLSDKDWNAAEQHLKRAVAISPAFAHAYQDLSLIAELRGNNPQRIEYLKKAAELNPTEPSYFFYYASAMKDADAEASRKLLQEAATRFPATERGAQGLYWAAYDTPGLPGEARHLPAPARRLSAGEVFVVRVRDVGSVRRPRRCGAGPGQCTRRGHAETDCREVRAEVVGRPCRLRVSVNRFGGAARAR